MRSLEAEELNIGRQGDARVLMPSMMDIVAGAQPAASSRLSKRSLEAEALNTGRQEDARVLVPGMMDIVAAAHPAAFKMKLGRVEVRRAKAEAAHLKRIMRS